MPVRFHCPQCQTLLSVTRRKIGEVLPCPKCGAIQLVPKRDALSGKILQRKVRQVAETGGEPSGFHSTQVTSVDLDEPQEVRADELEPEETSVQPKPNVTSTESTNSRSDSFSAASPPAASPPAASPPAARLEESEAVSPARARRLDSAIGLSLDLPEGFEESLAESVDEEPAEPSIVVYDDEGGTPMGPWTSAQTGGGVGGEVGQAPRRSSGQLLAPKLPHGMVMVSRRALFVQFLAFLILAGGAFAGGYFLGRADVSPQETGASAGDEATTQSPAVVEGMLLYKQSEGQLVGDSNAMVVALPRGKFPEASNKIPVAGLRPNAPIDLQRQEAIAGVEDLGGAVVQADEQGKFIFTLPQQGDYFLLVISSNAHRGLAGIQAEDRQEMALYFQNIDKLLASSKYRWSRLKFEKPWTPDIRYSFGSPGKDP